MTSRPSFLFFWALVAAACGETRQDSQTCADTSAVVFSPPVGADGSYGILVEHDATSAQCELVVQGGVVLSETVHCSSNDLGPIFVKRAGTDAAATPLVPGPLSGVSWAGLSPAAQVTLVRDGVTIAFANAILSPATSSNSCGLNAATILIDGDAGATQGP
jgi:hypothetical protein